MLHFWKDCMNLLEFKSTNTVNLLQSYKGFKSTNQPIAPPPLKFSLGKKCGIKNYVVLYTLILVIGMKVMYIHVHVLVKFSHNISASYWVSYYINSVANWRLVSDSSAVGYSVLVNVLGTAILVITQLPGNSHWNLSVKEILSNQEVWGCFLMSGVRMLTLVKCYFVMQHGSGTATNAIVWHLKHNG